ncbi:hypothetical protein SH2C18_31960 [Clostridium sediminicola]|uniref:ABC transporter permease n=1 Tax=Clostridium sediminicola TaxID=3114879 RepID=UPI0031F27B86
MRTDADLSSQVRVEKRGLIYDLKKLIGEPVLAAIILIVIGLSGFFVVYPFSKVVIMPQATDWMRFFHEERFLTAFQNTFYSSFLATLTATVFGFIYAYTMNYVDIPGKKFFRTIVLVPMMAPPVVTGIAFIVLFGRRGLITYSLLHMTTDLYGWIGLWIVQSMAFFPLAYMTNSGVLKAISPNLELAAQNLGAHGFKLFRTVTLPLALPGLLSASLLVAINSLADFGNPMLIGGDYSVLATEAYMQVAGQWDLKMAAVLSMVLVIPTLIVFFIQKYYLERRSFTTVTGKPVAGLKRVTTSTMTKWILFSFCCLIVLFICSIFTIVVLAAFTKVFGVNNTFTLNNFIEGIIKSSALKNSWLLAVISAIITTILGITIAFLISRKRFPGKNALDFITLLPASLPGTFIGIGLVLAFNQEPIMLTGTGIIIVIAMVMRQLPVGYRNSISAFKQIDKSIEEAATNLGANSFTVIRTIIIPMLKNAMSTSVVYSFMKSMNTLSAVIFLVSPQWMIGSIAILSFAEQGFIGIASAIAVGMVGIIFITFGIAKLLLKDKINIFDI